MVAYALVLEEMTNTSIDKGFFYIIPEDTVYPIYITNHHRKYIKSALTMIHDIVKNERYPEPHSRKRCLACEHKMYCHDIEYDSTDQKQEETNQMIKKWFGIDIYSSKYYNRE